MYYYDTPNYSVALNAKVASSSMARAIISQFFPKKDWMIKTAAFPTEQAKINQQWHWLANGKMTPDKPVVLLVRDPVERFITACQQIGLHKNDIDSAIESLIKDRPANRKKPDETSEEEWKKENTERQKRFSRIAATRAARTSKGKDVLAKRRANYLRDDVHFFHQHKYAIGPTHCFQFPRDINEAVKFIGIKKDFPKSNEAKREKPLLNKDQELLVRKYYSKDQELFDMIAHPNYIYIPDNSDIINEDKPVESKIKKDKEP